MSEATSRCPEKFRGVQRYPERGVKGVTRVAFKSCA